MGGAHPPAEAGKTYLLMAIAVLLLPALLGSSLTIFNDGDVSWHIASGQWILDHRAIPVTDPFSFTWAGKPWVPMEWLADVTYACAYRWAGYSGLAAVVTAAMVALHGLVYFNAGRWGRAGLPAVVAMDMVLIPSMLARPHVLIWPLLALWTWIMLGARERDRAPPLAAVLLIALWANLHASFVIGLFVAAVFGLEALVASDDKGRALRQWLFFGFACAAAVCINPNGIDGAIYPFRFPSLEMLSLIDEWKPSDPNVTPFFFGVLALVLALIAWRRPRLHPVRWLLLAALLGLALLQVRQQALLAIVAAMILPQGFARGAEAPSDPNRRASALVAGAGALVLVLARMGLPLSPPDNSANPWKLIAAVPPELRPLPVLNDYSMGGPLILSGIRPYIDGRGDMYGDELVVGFSRMSHGDRSAFDEVVRRWDIRWAILANEDKAFIAMLARSPEWRRIHKDQVGVIYVRR